MESRVIMWSHSPERTREGRLFPALESSAGAARARARVCVCMCVCVAVGVFLAMVVMAGCVCEARLLFPLAEMGR